MSKEPEFLKAVSSKMSELKDSYDGHGVLMVGHQGLLDAYLVDLGGTRHLVGTYEWDEVMSWPGTVGPTTYPQP